MIDACTYLLEQFIFLFYIFLIIVGEFDYNSNILR